MNDRYRLNESTADAPSPKAFTMLPNEIIENPEIDIYMQSTLLALYRFRSQNDNTCFPSYKVLAQYAKCSERHVIRMVKKLEEMGLVAVCRHDDSAKHSHSSNVYILPSLYHEEAREEAIEETKENLLAEQSFSHTIVKNKEKKKNRMLQKAARLSRAKQDALPYLAAQQSHLYDKQPHPHDGLSPPHDRPSPELYISNYTESNQNNLKNRYGTYRNVILNDFEYEALKKEFPSDYLERIERLSGYMKSKQRSYADHLATIRLWAKNDEVAQKKSLAKRAKPNYAQCRGESL